MSTKKYVLRTDATLTAGELAVLLQQLGILPNYVDVPEHQTVPETLKRFFIPVVATDETLSQIQAHHEETTKRIQDLEAQLSKLLNPPPIPVVPPEIRPLPVAVSVPSFDETLAQIRARGEEAARTVQKTNGPLTQ